jgi:iron(III) transport system permease protein
MLLASCLLAFALVAPVAGLVAIAAEGSGGAWPHLLNYVLPGAVRDTLILLTGVGCLVIAMGTGLAWLMTAYEFPGRRIFEWALLLPLAVPTYIIAYAWLDLLHPVGPVQDALRALLGVTGASVLPVPDVRSMGGCILLLSFVLYPYVFMPTRALFLMQAGGLLEAARMLGAGRRGVFFRVALPLARPAIALGASLALMETLNDIGASEFLGVRTLSVSIYATWVNRSNLPGAAQIALALMALAVALILIERWARRRQRYVSQTQRAPRARPVRLRGWALAGALTAASLPVLIGFVFPALYLVAQAWRRLAFAGLPHDLGEQFRNTVTLSAFGTLAALCAGFMLAYAVRITRAPLAAASLRVGSLGYAIPGTVLAIGLLPGLMALDGALADAIDWALGGTAGLILSSSGAALVYAYATRFVAISAGGVEAGFSKLSPSLDCAARALGETAGGALRRVHLPLLRPALGAAAVLVLVDCMKE